MSDERFPIRDALVAVGAVASCVGVILIAALVMVEPPIDEHSRVIGHSGKGKPILCKSFGSGQGGVLFLASIHGSEGAGTPLLEALGDYLSRQPDAWKGENVMVIAVANPDGLVGGARLNARGVDLNRNFPAENRSNRKRFGLEALSEPESRAIYDLIEERQPRVIVSIHQPLACIDYDGPANAIKLAEDMANLCQLPVKKLGSRPGSLGAYFGDTLDRPIITFELPRFVPHHGEKLWERYGQALLVPLRSTQP